MCGFTWSVTVAVRGIFAAAACAVMTTTATAQSKSPVPDFAADQAGWISTSNDFIPIPGGPRPVTFDPAHPYVPNNPRAQPTFRVADLTNPNLKPWVKDAMRKENAKVLAGNMAVTPRSSCMPAGVPGFMMFIVEPVYFIQSPKEVLINYSGDSQVRHVYLDAAHSPSSKPSWYGESVGQYEGDTLVIDTIGLNTRTTVDNYYIPHTENLHVVERWRLVEGGNILEVKFTVDDPDTFYEPWSAVQRYRRVQRPWEEQVCAENNAPLLFDYRMPVANRPDF